jgi:hypothetical protein
MALTATGIVFVLLGLFFFLGQFISAIDFSLAQQLGLQEKDADTERLYRRLELNTARWDLLVLWTFPAAGGLMLIDHAWWPYLALVAGGVYVDTAGRETAKILGLRRQGVRTGSARDARIFICFMGLMLLSGLWCIGLALAPLI